jgi:hypothetical protein
VTRTSFPRVLVAVALGSLLSLVVGCRSVSSYPPVPKTLTAAELVAVQAEPLGSIKNPIRCDGVQGERCYVARLRCPSGERPKIEGRFSILERSPYGTILDEYILRCSDWTEPRSIFLDMYHSGVLEERPADGFLVAATD